MLFCRKRSASYWGFVAGNLLFGLLALVCIGLLLFSIIFAILGSLILSESLIVAGVSLIILIFVRWYYERNLYLVNSIELSNNEFKFKSFFGQVTRFKKITHVEVFDKYFGSPVSVHKCIRVVHEKGSNLIIDVDDFENEKELIRLLKLNNKNSI